MRMLKFIGEFRELGYCSHGESSSIETALGKRAATDKREVVRYLRSGKMMILSPGLDADVFEPKELSDTPSIRTDGVYAWRELLAYYVGRYDVELPADFEAHMQAHGWTVPPDVDLDAVVLPPPEPREVKR